MTGKSSTTSIIFDDLKVLLLGIGIAAAVTVTVFGSLVLAFVYSMAGDEVTIKELVSPNKALVASIDKLRGGAVSPIVHRVYVQSNNKGWFDQRVLVGTLESALLNDHQTGVEIRWLSPTDLQIRYLNAKTTKIHTVVYVNASAVRIYQDVRKSTIAPKLGL